ncbi:MAG TPA: PRC-barrel domain-containing protein [Thermomicrobiales bacterium]|nr:PRC-barrel domain-containing protein [Thermomicrobiales bacterium]
MAVVSYERLRAMDVYDTNDDIVGIITDLVLDLDANDVYYAVMTPAGVLEARGLGMARFPVPLRAFQFLGDRVKLPREADFIRKAPPIAPDQPLNVSAEYAAKIFGFWGVAR